MFRIFKSRKSGPTDLTWEEKNSGNYLYPSKSATELQEFTNQEQKHRKKSKIEDKRKQMRRKMKKRYRKILQKYNKDKSRFLQVYAGIDLYRWGIPLFIHYVPVVGGFGIHLFRARFLCFLLEIEWMKLYIEKGDKDGKN